MITFNIIRGHRLILWAARLGFDSKFTKLLDKFGTYYVQNVEKIDEDLYTLIVLVKIQEMDTPFPIMFTSTEDQMKSLLEQVTQSVYIADNVDE